MITSILIAISLFLDPAEGEVCEMEYKIIADLESRIDECETSISVLESRIDECETTISVLDQVFLDFAIESGSAASGCESKPTQLEKDICECLAGGGGGAGLSRCIENKQGPA